MSQRATRFRRVPVAPPRDLARSWLTVPCELSTCREHGGFLTHHPDRRSAASRRPAPQRRQPRGRDPRRGHAPQLAPAAVADTYRDTATALVGVIATLNRQIGELEAAIATRFEQHPGACCKIAHHRPRAKKLAVAAGQFWSPGRCWRPQQPCPPSPVQQLGWHPPSLPPPAQPLRQGSRLSHRLNPVAIPA